MDDLEDKATGGRVGLKNGNKKITFFKQTLRFNFVTMETISIIKIKSCKFRFF